MAGGGGTSGGESVSVLQPNCNFHNTRFFLFSVLLVAYLLTSSFVALVTGLVIAGVVVLMHGMFYDPLTPASSDAASTAYAPQIDTPDDRVCAVCTVRKVFVFTPISFF